MLDQKFNKQIVVSKAPALLDMFFKPEELAAELCVDESIITNWLNHDLPFEETDDGIMVVGTVASEWIAETFQKKPKTKTPDTMGYCFHCNQSITMENTSIKDIGHTVLKQGTCPNCQSKVNRGIKKSDVL